MDLANSVSHCLKLFLKGWHGHLGGSSGLPKYVSPKKFCLAKINGGLEKVLFQKKMLQRGVNNTNFQIVKPGRLSSLLFGIHPNVKLFLKKCLLDPH